MKTAAYTICKNEINRVEQWLYYTKDFTHRYVLDTGSTDGTFERLKQVNNLTVEQVFPDEDTFDYSEWRNANLAMIPEDIDWCLSPDMDEYYSINVLDIIQEYHAKQNITIIACARLDIYSKKVFVGKPDSIGTNKIHRRKLYNWKQPVYEHLSYIGPEKEMELYHSDLFLIHDQEIHKSRNVWYPKIMKREYAKNPQNSWNSGFLANHYFKEQDLENFVDVGSNFVLYEKNKDEKYQSVLQSLVSIYNASNIPQNIKSIIRERLANHAD